MAHGSEKRATLRGLYVYQRLSMEIACTKAGVPKSTGNRWKAEAKAEGDDWDMVRSAMALGDENFATMGRRLLEDYLVQHQATMDMLRDEQGLSALDRAQTLASMSDSFGKTMASFRRLSPELNRQAIQLEVLQRMAAFVQQRFPQHVAAMLDLLEPFGEELAKAG
ncbi:DUF1804 family protein [Pseudacidovorax intermedius]|uniref:Uncharacterized protein n=1 Tax=Pseudacidovorax intermedius TaxID=433924 RepID=A0A147GW99_9BURK|nr:DUF1804 family protein [Pseudacidovorax intermedius]KTT21891.1 hypothetical protein NS331_11045 [Pseudacidovorax intermedius]